MLVDYFVPRLTGEQIERFACEARVRSDVDGVKLVDIIKVLSLTWVWTLKGTKTLSVRVIDDELMGNSDARAKSDKDSAEIEVRRSIWDAAKSKDPKRRVESNRARFTLAHELGHIVLCHQKAQMSRVAGVSSAMIRPRSIPPTESAERQADTFAAAYLIGKSLLRREDTAASVSAEFGVNLSAAEYRVVAVFPKKSAKVIEGFRELSRELSGTGMRAKVASITQSQNTFNNTQGIGSEMVPAAELCPKCGTSRTVSLGGTRMDCESCGIKGDFFQDGDWSGYEF
jgi:hypothetical protein